LIDLTNCHSNTKETEIYNFDFDNEKAHQSTESQNSNIENKMTSERSNSKVYNQMMNHRR